LLDTYFCAGIDESLVELIFCVGAGVQEGHPRNEEEKDPGGSKDDEEGEGSMQEDPEELKNYKRVAQGLYDAGYYSGVVSGIESSLRECGTFVIVDCPSGTGKTLAAVALSMQGLNNNPTSNFKLNKLPALVYHLIWPNAVNSQTIYGHITKSTKFNSQFFDRFPIIGERTGDEAITETIWNFLGEILPVSEHGVREGKAALLIIIDEVPADPAATQRLSRMRDALKLLEKVCVVLCGTHSKAANMVGLTDGEASRQNKEMGYRWAWIITRLPKFDLEISGRAEKLDLLSERTGSDHILSAIRNSLGNGGNPLLLSLAIDQAVKMENCRENSMDQFRAWQINFSNAVITQKFNEEHSRISHQFNGLVGQLNLLLGASATSHLSDILLGHHFAYRCIPDFGESCGTDAKAPLENCGGYLDVQCRRSRLAGTTLAFYRGKRRDMSIGYSNWQATRFAPPNKDLLLYLMALRQGGYFAASKEIIATHELVLPCWNGNSAGLMNFQDPRAVTNSGCLLEVLVTAAVKNAAANSIGGGTMCTVPEFILNLMSELGTLKIPTVADFNSDEVLRSIRIPTFLLLTKQSHGSEFTSMSGILGVAERQTNRDEFDLLVMGVGSGAGGSIRLGAKDRAEFGNGEMAKAASKLFRDGNKVGVIVVRNCCRYWDEGGLGDSDRAALKGLLGMIRGIGTAYLFSREGLARMIHVSDARPGRLILIQVPEKSLCESNPFAPKRS
jgi:hypothetical protein